MIVVLCLVMLGVAMWRFAATSEARYAPRPVCCWSASMRSDAWGLVRSAGGASSPASRLKVSR